MADAAYSPQRYSARFFALSAFVAIAVVLGGGGTPVPLPELAVQVAALVLLASWPFLASGERGSPADPALYWLAAVLAAPPLLQLVPLPPSLWEALPGRAPAAASLAAAGQAGQWMPMSLTPARTLAYLLALLPPVIAMLLASMLGIRERLAMLGVIAALGVGAALFALAVWLGEWSPYGGGHRQWVSGLNANRNAAADLFLLALAALAAWSWRREASAARIAIPAAILALAILLTGSRTGIALLVAGALVFALLRWRHRLRALLVAVGAIAAGAAAMLVFAPGRFAPVAARFDATGDARADLWQDSWHAVSQFWPMGSGLGSFPVVIQASERLSAVDESWPNRAHNEYLEIALEAGLPGLLAIAIGLALVARIIWRAMSDDRIASALPAFTLAAFGIIALHSVVDYPLRALSLACLAGLAVGLSGNTGRIPPEKASKRDGT
ncbi:O-antigen ligase family protein [Paraurantiacibacter namhicola]|uniref:O-Antigen ligase n=1 Tax=Paraurantiacibacter namhicola TaxID=645517 RepID=A0A1C7D619_9SPHN|nr:O-antigen ligase family protein [Paraurantiacibacter namhicola]ANU06904.1 O-Antigen ligase [Paraurantiacibacter namhicola]